MNWVLIGVLAVLLVNTLIGYKAGFIKTVFSLFSMIVALLLTIWINPTVNNLMRQNEKLYGTVYDKVDGVLPKASEDIEDSSSKQISYIEELPIPQTIKDSLIENNNNEEVQKVLGFDNYVDKFREYVANYITGIILNALSFVVTFVVILILLWVVSIILNIISKLPVLNQINKVAGLLAGLIHGLVIVWVLFLLLTVFGGTEIGKEAMLMISESQILSFLYNNNLLIGFITNGTKMLF
ncbi:MAG TPA: CvpA family protein [Clostridiales bacterium]|nr:CvpA family protein [Clostridiales bacterium]